MADKIFQNPVKIFASGAHLSFEEAGESNIYVPSRKTRLQNYGEIIIINDFEAKQNYKLERSLLRNDADGSYANIEDAMTYLLSFVGNFNSGGAAPITTGWASYSDTQYTDVSTFTLVANTDIKLPNNAGNVVDFQKPPDVTTFWDSSAQKIPGRSGDNLDVMLYWKALASANNASLDVWIDIGGSVGELYRQTFYFRGTDEKGVLYALPSAYTLNTWQANGADVFVRSSVNMDFYNIVFNFDRSHKAI